MSKDYSPSGNPQYVISSYNPPAPPPPNPETPLWMRYVFLVILIVAADWIANNGIRLTDDSGNCVIEPFLCSPVTTVDETAAR